MQNRQQNDGSELFFTPLDTIKKIAQHVVKFKTDETIVDFSCGDNQFATELKNLDKNISTLSFDIDPRCKLSKTVKKQDWLTVTSVPIPCIFGLNPPYGWQGSLAKKFIIHATNFNPTYMFLVIPWFKNNWMPKGYTNIHEVKLPNTYINPITKNRIKIGISTRFTIWKREDQPSDENTKSSRPRESLLKLGITTMTLLSFEKKNINIPANSIIIRGSGALAGEQAFIYHGKRWEKHDINKDFIELDSPLNYQPNNLRIIIGDVLNSYKKRVAFFNKIGVILKNTKSYSEKRSISMDDLALAISSVE